MLRPVLIWFDIHLVPGSVYARSQQIRARRWSMRRCGTIWNNSARLWWQPPAPPGQRDGPTAAEPHGQTTRLSMSPNLSEFVVGRTW